MDNYKDWDLEKIKEKAIEIAKYFWSQRHVRKVVYLGIVGLVAAFVALQMIIYLAATVFYELFKLLVKIILPG